jgi:predicted ATP-grasp superfamily ATP-dependent carboligase
VFPPAFASRWCALKRRVPDPRDEQRYGDSVLEMVRELRPNVLLPARDSTICVLRSRRAELERESRLALASEPALDVAVSKERTLALAERLGIPVPISIPIRGASDAAEAGARTGFPAVVKPVESWVRSPAGARQLRAHVALDADEAGRLAEAMMGVGGRVVLQQWLQGSREAVSLFSVDGKIHARFAQVARRMLPPLGGSSIVRESISLPRDLVDAAEALVRAAGLEGYAEIEFRRDVDGAAFLMEINARLSASVEVAVRAGVDFPSLLYAWAAGLPVATVSNYREGVRMRWLGGDIRWLRQTLEQQGRPEVHASSAAGAAFARDFFAPYAYDYLKLSDPWPAVAATASFLLVRPLRRHLKRLHRGRRNAPT